MLKPTRIFLLLCMVTRFAFGQYTVTIKVKAIPPVPPEVPLFITGNFNGWQVAAKDKFLHPEKNNSYTVTLTDIQAGDLAFRINRGSWKTLNCNEKGRLELPYTIHVHQDTTVYLSIAHWRDDFPVSTATPQVKKLTDSFYFPALHAYRTVQLYLPEGYDTSGIKYPVLYMPDGQDLFDEAVSRGRTGPLEWGVDETIQHSGYPCIVVAIYHPEDKLERIREYMVHQTGKYDAVKGGLWLKDLTTILKPFIDSHYRTVPDAAHTAFAGSSMGGLLAMYAGITYPEIFGTIGVFSPSVWEDESHWFTALNQIKTPARFRYQHYYFYGGGKEQRDKGDGTAVNMERDVKEVAKTVKTRLKTSVAVVINPEGDHGQWYWGLAFPAFYQYMLHSFMAP